MKALSTSVGRKFVMAITGLLLCGFLVAHLAGNLLLYVGAQEYNDYAHALHKQAGLLVVAEIGLFALFIAHIVIALQVSAENRLARKVGYAMKQSKQEGRRAEEMWRPDSWMLFTGIGVLGFLVLHLIDFKFGTELKIRDQALYFDGAVEKTPYDKAAALLSTPLTIIGYGFGCLFLAVHLAHGFSSAFQTLGLNHPKYTPTIKRIGLLFAFAIGVGFASFALIWKPSHTSGQAANPLPRISSANTTDRPVSAVPTPPPGTLEGVDDPRVVPANFEQRIERQMKKAQLLPQPSTTPQK